MATGQRVDPYNQYNFLVELDGITRAGFKECTGLETIQEVIEYREGGDRLAIKQLPGLIHYSNIILKRGMTTDKELWTWRKSAQDGKEIRKTGSIILLDQTGSEKGRWDFFEAWPVSWTGPEFDATANGVAFETIEITHEGLEMVAAKTTAA